MNDDQMDELLIQGVRDYNAQRGEVPRDEMWRRIQSARAESARTATTPVVSVEDRKRRRWVGPSIGVAAAAILVAGIAIGRQMERGTTTSNPAVASIAPTTHPDSATTSIDSSKDLVGKLHDQTKQTDQRVRALADAERASAVGVDDRSNGATPANQSLAYRLVVLQHLAGSEAMITSFRSSARTGQMDAELATWSRELLSTTRLLESSQASTDPVMKHLLDDLDLVISQIVQYTSKGATNPEELDLIEQSINKRGVMSKLRSTVPSRSFPAGS
ncbi:MAG TPA: hypothetical protein VGM82_07615 [Gemmatimonadaceae bacterium]|jgi:hypothetical protein